MLAKAVAAAGGTATSNGDGSLLVQGLPTDRVGDVAFEAGVRLHELAQTRASLEQAFMELTADSVEYHAGTTAGDSGGRHAGAPPDATAPVAAGQPGDTETDQARAGRVS